MLGVVVVAATACGSTGQGSAGSTQSSAAGGTLSVVASTDVWGDVVRQVGGDRVTVTSLLSDPSADPHSYEANAQNLLAVSRADVLVRNGGGYDDFMTTLIDSAHSTAPVLDAVALSGRAESEDLNEHVWYDLKTAVTVADAVADALGRKDPSHADTYRSNASRFDGAVRALEQQETDVARTARGAAVAITEPVPLYMLEAIGVQDRTPERFSEAVENETDVAPAVLAQTLALFSGHQVRALVYNEQTTGPQTEQVLAAAKANGVPVVPVTETLPEGQDYQGWMKANLDAIAAAVTR
ncbi:metal ABC transporter substrate-binding protein [Nakamurella endophytica]|uniref:Metal ABC transporter substrate-binding protein n=1 Tax=Nakamurella endophytica TaxID=1748367 RepID=A0A917T995_9ACTN|nr:metal ABC transporter substrate-binding protein [Nakamurella endophytica]